MKSSTVDSNESSMIRIDDSQHIRPAVAEDAEAIHFLIREIAAFEHLEDEFVGTVDELRTSLFLDEPPGADCLVAVDSRVSENAGVIGYAIFFNSYSTFLCKTGLWLEDLYVREAHRGSGVGKALLEAVRNVAVQRNAGRYEWCVLDWNQHAIDFYERAGAKVLPDWRIVRTVL